MIRFNFSGCLLLLAGVAAVAQQPAADKTSSRKASNTLAEIAKSHIRGNVPVRSQFDKVLKRDLAVYFTERTGKKVSVEYQFLREGATQTGIAYPKYYLWVKIKNGAKLIDEGAVRIAAVEQKQFDVTDYLPRAKMWRNPAQIYLVFPAPVGDKIKQRLK